MRLGASNLAWSPAAELEAFALLQGHGFKGVEVAPTRIAGWDDLTPAVLHEYRSRCDEFGLVVSSLQAIFFSCPEAKLLGSQAAFEAMCEQTRRVGEIAFALGATVAVFGAPRNRLRGDLDYDSSMKLGIERLRILGDIASKSELVLGIEPVPSYYGGDFLVRANEVALAITECNHPSVRAHFDCACIELGGDNVGEAIARYFDTIVHYHVAEQDLSSFSNPKCDHARAADALRSLGYGRWIVVEMRQHGDTGLAALKEALSTVKRIYTCR